LPFQWVEDSDGLLLHQYDICILYTIKCKYTDFKHRFVYIHCKQYTAHTC
jgi:hypothetical protein